MNAIEFVKEFGVESAVKIIRSAPASATSYRVSKNSKLGLVGAYGRVNNANCYVTSLCELKQIIKAFELVNLHGSLKLANHYAMKKTCLSEENTVNDLWDAINLVEQCQ